VSRLLAGFTRPAIADVADLSDESPRVGRVDGLLHGADAHGTGARRRRAFPPSTAHSPYQHKAHPTAEWAAQQVVEAFPDDTAPRWLHRDGDRIYGAAFQRGVAGMGIAEVVSAPASPGRIHSSSA